MNVTLGLAKVQEFKKVNLLLTKFIHPLVCYLPYAACASDTRKFLEACVRRREEALKNLLHRGPSQLPQ